MKDYLVKSLPGFSPVIGHLVSMMNYVRQTTLDAVSGLTVMQLDHLFGAEANSIGMLLEHIGSVEEYYQQDTFGWSLEGEQAERWQRGGNLGEAARQKIRGHELAYYLERLAGIRERTLDELARRDDAWLFEESAHGRHTGNNYFKWFHVFEDEIRHQGQIIMIRKQLLPY
jgi:uncharacterized damage-inducible protein DinB